MPVDDAIAHAETILSGTAASDGAFALRWGQSVDADLRGAISTCLLDHLLEHHFDAFIERVELESGRSRLFALTVCGCWKFGETKTRERSARFDRLVRSIRQTNA